MDNEGSFHYVLPKLITSPHPHLRFELVTQLHGRRVGLFVRWLVPQERIGEAAATAPRGVSKVPQGAATDNPTTLLH